MKEEKTSKIENFEIKNLTDKYNIDLEEKDKKIDDLNNEITTIKSSLVEIAKERDFYYSKLRDIEVLTSKQTNLNKDEFIKIIQNILFSSKDLEVKFDDTGNVNLI